MALVMASTLLCWNTFLPMDTPCPPAWMES